MISNSINMTFEEWVDEWSDVGQRPKNKKNY